MNGQEQITALTAQVTKATTVEKSAEVFINGVGTLISNAVSAALANGGTAEQLQPLTDLGTAMDAESDILQVAITANTPAA